MRERYLVYRREREESTSVKIARNNTMSIRSHPLGEPGGLSIKETGAGNRALYSQHKPPMQKRNRERTGKVKTENKRFAV